MKIALLQCNSVTGDVAGNQERILEAARQAAREGADLCVTPELALCGVAPGHYLRAVDFAEDLHLIKLAVLALHTVGDVCHLFTDG